MKLNKVTFNDDGTPDELTFTMSAIESNAILGVFGQFNGHAHEKMLYGPKDDVYEGLSQAWCMLDEDGCMFKIPPIATLNGAPS